MSTSTCSLATQSPNFCLTCSSTLPRVERCLAAVWSSALEPGYLLQHGPAQRWSHCKHSICSSLYKAWCHRLSSALKTQFRNQAFQCERLKFIISDQLLHWMNGIKPGMGWGYGICAIFGNFRSTVTLNTFAAVQRLSLLRHRPKMRDNLLNCSEKICQMGKPWLVLKKSADLVVQWLITMSKKKKKVTKVF